MTFSPFRIPPTLHGYEMILCIAFVAIFSLACAVGGLGKVM